MLCSVTPTFGQRGDTGADLMLDGSMMPGSSITCTATATDTSGASISIDATTTLSNRAPTVSSVTIDPGMAYYTDSTFNATVTLDDADTTQTGDLTASYQWYADGAPVSGNMASLSNGTLNEFFAKGQDVYVVVTPNDGVEDGTPVQSNTVSVLNSLPILTGVSVTPDPAVMGTDDLLCDVTATDADGDQILYTYDWSDSSGTQQSTVEVSDTSDTFLTDGLTADTWTCTVTPFDGEEYGVSDTGSTTVENSLLECTL